MLKSIKDSILVKPNNDSGMNINNAIPVVIIEIDKLNELDKTILLRVTSSSLLTVFFSTITPSAFIFVNSLFNV